MIYSPITQSKHEKENILSELYVCLVISIRNLLNPILPLEETKLNKRKVMHFNGRGQDLNLDSEGGILQAFL